MYQAVYNSRPTLQRVDEQVHRRPPPPPEQFARPYPATQGRPPNVNRFSARTVPGNVQPAMNAEFFHARPMHGANHTASRPQNTSGLSPTKNDDIFNQYYASLEHIRELSARMLKQQNDLDAANKEIERLKQQNRLMQGASRPMNFEERFQRAPPAPVQQYQLPVQNQEVIEVDEDSVNTISNKTPELPAVEETNMIPWRVLLSRESPDLLAVVNQDNQDVIETAVLKYLEEAVGKQAAFQFRVALQNSNTQSSSASNDEANQSSVLTPQSPFQFQAAIPSNISQDFILWFQNNMNNWNIPQENLERQGEEYKEDFEMVQASGSEMDDPDDADFQVATSAPPSVNEVSKDNSVDLETEEHEKRRKSKGRGRPKKDAVRITQLRKSLRSSRMSDPGTDLSRETGIPELDGRRKKRRPNVAAVSNEGQQTDAPMTSNDETGDVSLRERKGLLDSRSSSIELETQNDNEGQNLSLVHEGEKEMDHDATTNNEQPPHDELFEQVLQTPPAEEDEREVPVAADQPHCENDEKMQEVMNDVGTQKKKTPAVCGSCGKEATMFRMNPNGHKLICVACFNALTVNTPIMDFQTYMLSKNMNSRSAPGTPTGQNSGAQVANHIRQNSDDQMEMNAPNSSEGDRFSAEIFRGVPPTRYANVLRDLVPDFPAFPRTAQAKIRSAAKKWLLINAGEHYNNCVIMVAPDHRTYGVPEGLREEFLNWAAQQHFDRLPLTEVCLKDQSGFLPADYYISRNSQLPYHRRPRADQMTNGPGPQPPQGFRPSGMFPNGQPPSNHNNFRPPMRPPQQQQMGYGPRPMISNNNNNWQNRRQPSPQRMPPGMQRPPQMMQPPHHGQHPRPRPPNQPPMMNQMQNASMRPPFSQVPPGQRQSYFSG